MLQGFQCQFSYKVTIEHTHLYSINSRTHNLDQHILKGSIIFFSICFGLFLGHLGHGLLGKLLLHLGTITIAIPIITTIHTPIVGLVAAHHGVAIELGPTPAGGHLIAHGATDRTAAIVGFGHGLGSGHGQGNGAGTWPGRHGHGQGHGAGPEGTGGSTPVVTPVRNGRERLLPVGWSETESGLVALPIQTAIVALPV